MGGAAVRLIRQIRVGVRLAKFYQADRTCPRQGAARYYARRDPYRSAFDVWRQPPWARFSRWPGGSRRSALLHQLSLAAVYSSRRHGGRRLRGLPRPSGGYPMTEERAV